MLAFLVAVAVVGVFFGLAYLGMFGAGLCRMFFESDLERRDREVREGVICADHRIAGEHRKARQAMNDASGQSWRNRFE